MTKQISYIVIAALFYTSFVKTSDNHHPSELSSHRSQAHRRAIVEDGPLDDSSSSSSAVPPVFAHMLYSASVGTGQFPLAVPGQVPAFPGSGVQLGGNTIVTTAAPPKTTEAAKEEARATVAAEDAEKEARAELARKKFETAASRNEALAREKAIRDFEAELEKASYEDRFRQAIEREEFLKRVSDARKGIWEQPLTQDQRARKAVDRAEKGALAGVEHRATMEAMQGSHEAQMKRRIVEQLAIDAGRMLITQIPGAAKFICAFILNGIRYKSKKPLTTDDINQIRLNAFQAVIHNADMQRKLVETGQIQAETVKVQGQIIYDLQQMMPSTPEEAAKLKPLLEASKHLHFRNVQDYLAASTVPVADHKNMALRSKSAAAAA